jgi:hypothetical protein
VPGNGEKTNLSAGFIDLSGNRLARLPIAGAGGGQVDGWNLASRAPDCSPQ